MPAKKIKCDTCHKEKGVKSFNQKSRAPVSYATTCIACEAKAVQGEIAKAAEKRLRIRASKLTKAEKKQLDKTAANEASRRKKQYVKLARKQKVQDLRKEREKYRRKQAMTYSGNAQQRELAARVLCQRHFLPFVRRFQPNYHAGWVHKDICRRLEQFYQDVVDGKSPRLMLTVPPRHGKSLLASDYFPSWVLGKKPDFEIIASSYAVSLPIGFSRRVRTRVQDRAFRNIFEGCTLDQESKSAEAWKTTVGGGYVAAGVGGGITGKGAHILIIDDPVKDAEEADSENMRDKVWDWYGSTAYTRLAPGGGVLVIQTRWHDDDLSGRLLAHMKQQLDDEGVPNNEIDKWELVNYPAIAVENEYLHLDGTISTEKEKGSRKLRSKGDPLHAQRFPASRLAAIKRSIQPRHWSALYQQNPVPDEGAYFTKDMFRYTPMIPNRNEMAVYIAWDLAIGERQQNDWTVGAVMGHSWDGQIYVLDIIRGKWGSQEIAQAVVNAAHHWKPDIVGLEKGQIEMAVMPLIKREMTAKNVHITFDDTLRPMTDKAMRARPLQGLMQQGMVRFPSGNAQKQTILRDAITGEMSIAAGSDIAWVEKAQHELLRFPAGQHDDIVDALAWGARIIVNQTPPDSPSIRKKHKSGWRDKVNKIAREQRMGRKSYMGV